MDFLGAEYYELHVTLMTVIGLWPYENARLRLFQNICFFIILVSGFTFQCTTFLTVEYTTQLFLKNLSPIFATLIFITKYVIFWMRAGSVLEGMEKVKYDWDELDDGEELKIISKHSDTGRFHARIFTIFLFPSTVTVIMSQFTADILNFVIPLNESRPRQLPLMMEYFIDQEKHFYIVAFYTDLMIIIGITTLVATEALYIMCMQHICGLLEIVGYRIHQAFHNASLFVPKNSTESLEALKKAVYLHCKALEFSSFLKEKFGLSYLILLAVGMVSISVNIYRFFQAIILFNDLEEILTSAFVVTSHFGYIFYINYMVQRVIDWSTFVFAEAYKSKWYEGVLLAKKSLYLILFRSMRAVSFELYSIYNPSIEGFSLLIKLAMSYFTALHSTQSR